MNVFVLAVRAFEAIAYNADGFAKKPNEKRNF